MNTSRLALMFGFVLLFAAPIQAQTVITPATAQAEWIQPDFSATLPVDDANAGQPNVTGFQFALFRVEQDVSTAGIQPVAVGPIVPKSNATIVPGVSPPTVRMLFSRTGVTIPPCTAVAPATCPVYTMVVVAVGPNGATPWQVASESDPFTLAPRVLTQTKAAAPTSVKVKSN